MNLINSSVLACDVGGSHVTAATVDLPSCTITHKRSAPLDPDAPAATILNALEDAGRQVATQSGSNLDTILGIACAFPAPFDYDAGVSLLRHKYAALYQADIRAELSRRFELPPNAVTFMHDAQAFLLGEICRGVARNAARVIGITLGTGIGSAFAVAGKIVEKGTGVPPGGEVYHLSWEQGTVEDAVSTQFIQSRYKQLTGDTLSVKEISLRASSDHFAEETMREFGSNLGRVLDAVTPAFAPDLIVLGGGISRSATLFLPSIHSELTHGRPEVAVSSLLDEAAVVGLAAHWQETNRKHINPDLAVPLSPKT
jgi:glucokinase